MGITCRRIVGFSLDITDEMHLLDDVSNKKIVDNIEMVYDGLNGEYCKLFYILASDNIEYYENTEVDDTINVLLKKLSY